MRATDYIETNRLRQFYEILIATGGRYLREPVHYGTRVEVVYEPGDYVAQCEAWKRITTPIRETFRNQWWRKLLRRIGLWV